MSGFKIGDKVRVACPGLKHYGDVGSIESVLGAPTDWWRVVFPAADGSFGYFGSELVLVEEAVEDGSPATDDPVNHPSHYTWLPNGTEVIEITEHMNFCLGNAIKYILRADHKDNTIQDLEKAIWYINREKARREAEAA